MISNDTSIQLYQSIAAANKEREYEAWHASSLAMCPRAQYFLRKGAKPFEKPSAAKVLRWEAGHHIETSIRKHIEDVYGRVESNKRITSKKYDLSGEFDNFAPESKTIIEIKSVDDMAFLERNGVTGLKQKVGNLPDGRNKWGLSEKPYPHHQIQNHAYVLLLKETGQEVEHIDYIYISLRGRIVGYKTDVDEKYTNNVQERLKVLNEAWETQTPPACICQEIHPLWKPVLQYCPFRKEGQPCCQVGDIK